MIVILEKEDLKHDSRHKVIDEIELRHDFNNFWSFAPNNALVIFRYQNEIKVFVSSNCNWEGMVYDGDMLYELIHRFIYHNQILHGLDTVQCIKSLSKVIQNKQRLEQLTYGLQAELFERT